MSFPDAPRGIAPDVIAHRGASTLAPENTLAAFLLAEARGARWIECDVRRSADGALVVMHDATVSRTTGGTGRVGALPLRSIRALDAGAWFDARYRGERVPVLEEVLGALQPSTGIIIEIKPSAGRGRETQALAESLSAVLRARSAHGKVLVTSFSTAVLGALRSADAAVPLGVLHFGRPAHVQLLRTLDRLGARSYFQNVLTVTAREIERLHRHDIRVGVFTANGVRAVRHALRCGVDMIVTDDTVRAASLITRIYRQKEE